MKFVLSRTCILSIFLVMGFLVSGCEELSWKKAVKHSSEESFERYLDRYPDGPNAATAKAAIEELFYKSCKKTRTEESLRKYLERYPAAEHTQHMESLLISVVRKDLDTWDMQKLLNHYVIVSTSGGEFMIAFFPQQAPLNVRSFLALSKAGFYDGLLFHQLVPARYIRGGDPRGDGTGGPGYAVVAEFNIINHQRGIVSMFRSKLHPDTAGSQFTISLSELPEFDGQYTVIGQVFEGLEVLDGIPQRSVIQQVKLMEADAVLRAELDKLRQDTLETAERNRQKYGLEQQALNSAISENNVQALGDFLGEYPKSRHKPQVIEQLLGINNSLVQAMSEKQMSKMIARIETNMGTIKFEFFADVAPGHVRNFIKLARSRFYDGVIFHRVIEGFMIQGGDPTGLGNGGPGYQIPAEFNDKPHLKGTVSMARTSDPDSAGSQFFICLNTKAQLDGKYTVFGQVVEGLEVLEAIGRVETVKPGDRPLEKVVMTRVVIED